MTGIYRVDDEGRNETLLQEAFTPDILDCDHPRDFWVLYTYGLVLFGKGQTLFQDVLLDVLDVEMEPVHELAPSAGGAKWIFNRDYGICRRPLSKADIHERNVPYFFSGQHHVAR